MTDKQIIIDGLACVNCPEAKRCQEQQAKKEYAINQVLQDIPTEYANVIARLKQIIPFVTRCDYVLEKQLKAKEQECEQQKAELELFKTSNQTTIDQLKSENENLRTEWKNLKWDLENNIQVKNHAMEENNKLKQTLADIKEIVHFNKTNRLSGGACISIEQILQKINEVVE